MHLSDILSYNCFIPLQQNSCSYASNHKGATQSGVSQIKSGDESALLAAVYSVGPISVAVDARSNAFKVCPGL